MIVISDTLKKLHLRVRVMYSIRWNKLVTVAELPQSCHKAPMTALMARLMTNLEAGPDIGHSLMQSGIRNPAATEAKWSLLSKRACAWRVTARENVGDRSLRRNESTHLQGPFFDGRPGQSLY